MTPAKSGSPNIRYFVRFALLAIAVLALECATLFLLKKPFPLIAIIPGLVPIFIVPLIIIPMQREKQKH